MAQLLGLLLPTSIFIYQNLTHADLDGDFSASIRTQSLAPLLTGKEKNLTLLYTPVGKKATIQRRTRPLTASAPNENPKGQYLRFQPIYQNLTYADLDGDFSTSIRRQSPRPLPTGKEKNWILLYIPGVVKKATSTQLLSTSTSPRTPARPA